AIVAYTRRRNRDVRCPCDRRRSVPTSRHSLEDVHLSAAGDDLVGLVDLRQLSVGAVLDLVQRLLLARGGLIQGLVYVPDGDFLLPPEETKQTVLLLAEVLEDPSGEVGGRRLLFRVRGGSVRGGCLLGGARGDLERPPADVVEQVRDGVDLGGERNDQSRVLTLGPGRRGRLLVQQVGAEQVVPRQHRPEPGVGSVVVPE